MLIKFSEEKYLQLLKDGSWRFTPGCIYQKMIEKKTLQQEVIGLIVI